MVDVNATINGFSHILGGVFGRSKCCLRAPWCRHATVMTASGGRPATQPAVTFTLDDEAASPLPPVSLLSFPRPYQTHG